MNEQSNGQTGSYQPWKSKWVSGILNYFRQQDGSAAPFMQLDGANRKLILNDTGDIVINGASMRVTARVQRFRTSTANINTGATLLPALAGYKYALLDAFAISIGGSAATCTTVDLKGTQSASGVKLVAFGQAALTQSTLVRAGSAGGVLLADGASFVPCDANTAITIGSTTNNLATSTFIDMIVAYYISQ